MNNPTEMNIGENRTELKGFREFYTREIEPQVVARKERQRVARRRLLFFGATGGVPTMVVGWLLFKSHGLKGVKSTGIGGRGRSAANPSGDESALADVEEASGTL